MAKNTETFVIGRQDLRRILVAFGLGEKSIEQLLDAMEKAHRHINVIAFAGMLEKAGLDRDRTVDTLRRLGVDDITIQAVLNAADDSKVLAETGRLFNVAIEFG